MDDVRGDNVGSTAAEEARERGALHPGGRRDTQSVSPRAFTGLRDIALTQSPQESGTLKGVEADPSRIRAAMLTRQRILLVTDTPQVAKPPTTARDRTKISVLRKYFTPVADEQTRGRRVTVYERLVSVH